MNPCFLCNMGPFSVSFFIWHVRLTVFLTDLFLCSFKCVMIWGKQIKATLDCKIFESCKEDCATCPVGYHSWSGHPLCFHRKLLCSVFMRRCFFVHRHSVGDTKVPFCLQSCVKPLEYAIAVNDLGSDLTHHFVGKEPSGFRFNKLSLNEDGECSALLRYIFQKGKVALDQHSCWPLHPLTFATTGRLLTPTWAIQDYVVRSGYYRMPLGLASMKYPRYSIYLFNSSLLLPWSWAVCDNMPLFLVQISHTTRWWMPEQL